jgi:hypothetical protein
LVDPQLSDSCDENQKAKEKLLGRFLLLAGEDHAAKPPTKPPKINTE